MTASLALRDNSSSLRSIDSHTYLYGLEPMYVAFVVRLPGCRVTIRLVIGSKRTFLVTLRDYLRVFGKLDVGSIQPPGTIFDRQLDRTRLGLGMALGPIGIVSRPEL